MAEEKRRLRVGVLGCGPIAQAAHLESCRKARNADLYAICDVAPDLLERMASTHRPERTYAAYEDMLADPDARRGDRRDLGCLPRRRFHRRARSRQACALRKAARRVASRRRNVSRAVVRASGRVLQVGHMKRFDAGLEAAKAFIDVRDGGDAGAQGLVLRLHAPLCDDRRRAAADREERAGEAARRQSEGRPPPLLHARAWQPPGRHRALFRRRDRCG